MDSSLIENSPLRDSLRGESHVANGVLHAALQIRGRTHQLWNALLGRQCVHMLHIGKTGGTAMKTAFRQIADRVLVTYSHGRRTVKASFRQARGGRDLVLRLHPHNFTLRNVPVGDKVFFFVRDPLARFVSGFYSRKRQGQPRRLKRWTPAEATAFARFETPNALGGALASQDPSIREAAVAAMRGITHVQSSYWDWFRDSAYFESRLNDILFIGFQETLDDDFEILKSLLNLPSHARLPADDVTSHRSPRGLDRTLDDTAEAAVRKWYARDYEFLDRCRSLRSRWCQSNCEPAANAA